MRFSLVGTRVPELQSEKDQWINSVPIFLKNVEEMAVLIKFWDYTCINCIRSIPYTIEWSRKYRNHNLLTIGIHSPEFSFGKNKEYVKKALNEFDISFPVLLDNEYKNWKSFANRYWPRTILIDPNGKIVYDKIGEGNYEETENAIRKLLLTMNPDDELPEMTYINKPEDRYGAECYIPTREIFTSSRQGVFGNDEEFDEGENGIYIDSGKRVDGVLILNGCWIQTDEFIFNIPDCHLDNYLVFIYSAKEVYGVFGCEENHTNEIIITQDGKPIPKEFAGADIVFNENQESVLKVSIPRLYRLIKNDNFSSHELKLDVKTGICNIYSFTFGTCIK
ncbi:MAG: redoxin family protein [Armatimonadota bacterium]